MEGVLLVIGANLILPFAVCINAKGGGHGAGTRRVRDGHPSHVAEPNTYTRLRGTKPLEKHTQTPSENIINGNSARIWLGLTLGAHFSALRCKPRVKFREDPPLRRVCK